MDISSIYEPVQSGLEKVEERLWQLGAADSGALKELLQHVLGQSGKRLRPALTLLVGKACDCDPESLVPMATAVELFHTATLVHDDTVDGSALRRGRPTVSSVWGGGRAVLFGDYLFALAAELASTTGDLRVVTLFAQTLRTVSSSELGQSLRGFDLSQTKQRYYDSIASKTASLFVLATESAAILSRVPEELVVACRNYGYSLGMAFQVVDDILDFVGVEEDLGKPVGADLLQGVVTLPVILAIECNLGDNRVVQAVAQRDAQSLRALLEMAREASLIGESYKVAGEFCSTARACAERLPEGRARQSLIDLTRYVTERKK
ncbi:MAG: polyprenyl synthetase family protein [Chloroflexota bacterium]